MSASAFIPERNLIDRQDAKNEVTHYDYNSMNRLTNVVNQGQWKASFAYDANGNLLNQQSAIANQQFSYDSMNRLFSSLISVNSRSFAVTNSYDLNGNRTNIVYPGGLTVGYSYDAENRLTAVTAKNAQITKTFAFGYDGASRLTGLSYPNGVNSTFGYDAESRITNYTHGAFISRSITRDPRGFKTQEDLVAGLSPSFPEGEQRMVHNAADQLTKITQRDTWLGGELNQWYDRNYSYDNNGCLTQENVSRPSWNTNSAIQEYSVDYAWDYDNRLTSVSGGMPVSATEYIYDASGSRIGRIANGVTNYFILDYRAPLKMPLAETDAQGNITRYYIWSSHGLLAHIDAVAGVADPGSICYYHADEQGSTLALTDESGNVTDQFAYTPYGGVTRTGTTQTRFQWLGGIAVQNEGDGLYFMLNRYYSAGMRRFISCDPSGINGGANLYSYAGLNPLAFVDPYGLEAIKTGDSASPWQVGWEWLTGTGPREHQFTGGDSFTTILQQHGHIQDVRDTLAANLANGGSLEGRDDYSLGGLQGIPDFIGDYSAVFTGGQVGNLAAAYLGSYNLEYNVISFDSESGLAQVQFHVWNTSTIASGTRPPIIGYTQWYYQNIAQPLNSVFSSGPMSPTTQDFRWTELIKY